MPTEKISIQDLRPLLAQRTHLSEDDAEQLAKAMFQIISDELENGNPIKVKGLGTFKIVDVDPRESVNVNTGERMVIEGHGKISFTPEATLKEIVNRPFSQFETVVLNDGVEFPEDLNQEEPQPEPTPEVQTAELPMPIAEEEQPTEEAEPIVETSEPIVEASEPAVETEEQSEDVRTSIVEFADSPDDNSTEEQPTEETPETEEAGADDETDEHDEKRTNTLLMALLWTVVVAASLFIGYLYGANETAINNAIKQLFTPTERTVCPVKPKSTAKPQPQRSAIDTTVNRKDSVTETKAEKDQATTEEEAKKAKTSTATEETIDYGARDARVRTGAYVIVGTETVITVKKGETLKQISDRTLGPGMECYVEVYNNIKPDADLTEGTKLKIPELKLKRKR